MIVSKPPIQDTPCIIVDKRKSQSTTVIGAENYAYICTRRALYIVISTENQTNNNIGM